jgi:hypothetical protein
MIVQGVGTPHVARLHNHGIPKAGARPASDVDGSGGGPQEPVALRPNTKEYSAQDGASVRPDQAFHRDFRAPLMALPEEVLHAAAAYPVAFPTLQRYRVALTVRRLQHSLSARCSTSLSVACSNWPTTAARGPYYGGLRRSRLNAQ